MSEQQYDNTNELALWKPRNERRQGYYVGGGDRTDFNGNKVDSAVLIVLDHDNPKAPFAELWLSSDGVDRRVIIWNNDEKLGGKIDGWWVNIFINDRDSGPPMRVKFKAMEATAAAVGASSGGGIPI